MGSGLVTDAKVFGGWTRRNEWDSRTAQRALCRSHSLQPLGSRRATGQGTPALWTAHHGNGEHRPRGHGQDHPRAPNHGHSDGRAGTLRAASLCDRGRETKARRAAGGRRESVRKWAGPGRAASSWFPAPTSPAASSRTPQSSFGTSAEAFDSPSTFKFASPARSPRAPSASTCDLETMGGRGECGGAASEIGVVVAIQVEGIRFVRRGRNGVRPSSPPRIPASLRVGDRPNGYGECCGRQSRVRTRRSPRAST